MKTEKKQAAANAIILFLLFIGSYQAETFTDTTQLDFSQGTFQQTEATFDGNIVLSKQTGTSFFPAGTFTSRIFDSTKTNTQWNTLSWIQQGKYQKQLPDNKATETDASMQGNILLLHFNSDANGTTSDSSGESNNALLKNGAEIGPTGLFNTNALLLFGASSFVAVQNSPSLALDKNLSILFWVKTSQSQDANAVVISKTDQNNGFRIQMNPTANSNNYSFAWKNSNQENCLATGEFILSPFDWQLLAITKDQNTTRIYIDGVQTADCTGTNASIGQTDSNLEIGGINGAGNWRGKIEELAVFNRPLAAEEIQKIFARKVASIKMQARSCNDANCSGENFIGPEGTSASFFSTEKNFWDLNAMARNRFFQYKALLETTDSLEIKKAFPTLLETSIVFSPQADQNQITEPLPGITVSFGFEEAAIANNEAIGLKARIKNNANTQKCGALEIETGTSFVEATVSSESFCLNPGQETEKPFTLKALNAVSGTYTIRARHAGATNTFPLRVGTFPSIEIIPFNQSVCRTGFREIGIEIRNNSSRFREIELMAGNEALLPEIQPSKINLDAFQTKRLAIKIFSNKNTAVGNYNVQVFAKTATEIVSRNISVVIVDCETQADASFTVNLNTTGCTEIEKGKGATVSYSVRNRLSESKEIGIALLSELPAVVKQKSIELEPNQTLALIFDVNATAGTAAKDYNVFLIVFDKTRSIEKTLCFRVKKTTTSGMEVLNNSQTAQKGSSIVFRVLVRNEGDTDSNYSVSVSSVPQNVFASISSEKFGLEKNTQKEIFVSISATELSSTGNYSIELNAKTDRNMLLKAILDFRITEQQKAERKMEITVYPEQVLISQTGEKTIVVRIENASGARQRAAFLEISNLPAGISSERITGIELLNGEAKTIETKLFSQNALPGTYSAAIVLESQAGREEKTMQITVPGAAGTGFAAGLFGLAGTEFSRADIFSSVFLTIVLLIVLMIFIGLAVGTPARQKEAWLRRQ